MTSVPMTQSSVDEMASTEGPYLQVEDLKVTFPTQDGPVTAVQGRDLPVVQATALFSAVVLIISNLLVDVVYSVLDPRVRLS